MKKLTRGFYDRDTVVVVRLVKRPRVGVDYAGHWAKRHLRFYIRGNSFVSKP
jgi:3-methyladenine DNA glycosylase Mpg